MLLPIENWILEKNYSINIQKLFSEAVICYRNGGYRASLIFSYIGFLTIIKETLIRSKSPVSFTEPEWQALIANLNNDDLWEKQVFETLIATKKPVFQLNEDLKLQLRYWKDRRNDCAHFKNNEIEAHHTDSFWSFIKSNISKMTIEGGMASLLNKFRDHFDDTLTPPNSDYSHLAREINTSVLLTELSDFFNRLGTYINAARFYQENETKNVYNKIMDVSNARTQEALIQYLKEENRDIKFLYIHSNKLQRFNYSPAEIRQLWKGRMYESDYWANPFNIYVEMLKNQLIPPEQIEEANRELFNKFSQTNYHRLPEQSHIDTLKANGFFETIFKIAIEEKQLTDYTWVNSKCDLIICYIKNISLNTDTIRCICQMASNQYHSQWLVKELKRLFAEEPELNTQFIQLAKENSITIPQNLN